MTRRERIGTIAGGIGIGIAIGVGACLLLCLGPILCLGLFPSSRPPTSETPSITREVQIEEPTEVPSAIPTLAPSSTPSPMPTSTQTPIPTPTPTTMPSPTPTPIPPTATPTKVLPTPTPMPTATPTPSPLVDTQDAAFVLALDNLMTYQGAVVVGLLEDIADASQRVDVTKLCQAADDLVTACLVFGAELEALPSPAHSYLTRSYACLEQAVTSFGAVGLAIQDFCDTGDTLKLYSAIEGMNQGTEQLTCATEWLDKYRGEIQ